MEKTRGARDSGRLEALWLIYASISLEFGRESLWLGFRAHTTIRERKVHRAHRSRVGRRGVKTIGAPVLMFESLRRMHYGAKMLGLNNVELILIVQ